MLEILTFINRLLDSKIVQWLLMLIIVCITAVCVYYSIHCAVLQAENDHLVSVKASLESSLAVQNAAIERAGYEAAEQKKKLNDAVLAANTIDKQRKALISLSGSCEQMIDQVVQEVK